MKKSRSFQPGFTRTRRSVEDNSSFTPCRYGKTYRAARRNTVIREVRPGDTPIHKPEKGGGGIWHPVYYSERHSTTPKKVRAI